MKDPAWTKTYSEKVKTADDAVRLIPRGRRILIGSGAAEPEGLTEALVRNADAFSDNEIVHLLTLGPAPYVKAGLEAHFRHVAFFIGANVREAVQQGRADFMPIFLSEIPRLIRTRRVRIDVALVEVSPPDEHGYVSLGVSVDVVRAAVDTADLVIAEVNEQMPRTHGNSFIHVSEIDALVPVDRPLPELPVEEIDEVSAQIGEHCARLVPNGATLQVGIGKIPNAVLAALAEHEELGVHTEMFSDGVMKLVEKGVITGRKKTLLEGAVVTSFVMGTKELYEWVDDNPLMAMRDSSFTNDPTTIARNDRMVSINSALAVDLTGQVASDTLNGRFFSGIGGQVDFIRGAVMSEGGRSIIALPSTAKGGKVSRIQAAFQEGAGVVTSRGDVRYVVTEYGIADLWGKNIRARALSLIEIAHPAFREQLLAEAKERNYVLGDQLAPSAVYPWAEARLESLFGGEQVLVRPARLSDEEGLQDLLYRMSDESIFRRFLAYRQRHPHEEMQQLVDLDYEDDFALVVETTDVHAAEPVALARYDIDPATGFADIAFMVRDDWQGKGLGKMLMRRMTSIARARGLRGFVADMLASNTPMIRVFHNSGLRVTGDHRGGVYRITAHIE